MPDYASLRKQATFGLPGGGKTYTGQAEDPFFADLRVFDLLYGGDLSERGQDTLVSYNVNTIAIQVPKKQLALRGNSSRNPVIGVWSTTDRAGVTVADSRDQKGKGGAEQWKQVSRLGNPLVNEVVVPLKFKDAFNTLNPSQDRTVQPVVDKVYDPILPKLIQQVYGIPAPATPRNDLAEIYLTGICKVCGPIKADLNAHRLNKDAALRKIVPAEELRLNMAVPPTAKPQRLGVLAGDLVEASRTGDASPTTSSTSRSRPSRAPPRPAFSSPNSRTATRSTPTRSRSAPRSPTSRCRTPRTSTAAPVGQAAPPSSPPWRTPRRPPSRRPPRPRRSPVAGALLLGVGGFRLRRRGKDS